MKRRQSVYYEEASEDFLKYTGDMVAYQKQMVAYVLPSRADFLLKHIAGVTSFLDAIYTALYERECMRERLETEDHFACLLEAYDATEEDRIIVRDNALEELRLDLIVTTLFRWHADIMMREGEEMTGAYAVSYFASWGDYCRAFHLLVCNQPPEKLALYTELSAPEDAYCQMVSQHSNVIVSDEPLMSYSVGDLFNTMLIMTPSLYTYSFSPRMRIYIYALFFRYADLLACEQPEETIEDVFHNPLFINYHTTEESYNETEQEAEMFDAFKKLSIRVNSNYSINNDFLYEGEAIFYHQMYRLQISTDVVRYHASANRAIRIAYNTSNCKRIDILKQALDVWHTMCLAICVDTYLKPTLIEKYTTIRTEMHLYHGDRERYIRKFPTAATDARDVLLEARPLEMMAVNKTQSMVLADLLTVFKNSYSDCFDAVAQDATSAFEQRIFDNGHEEWLTPKFEQEALLLTKMCTALYFELQLVKAHKSMAEAFVLEEMVTLTTIEERLFIKHSSVWPLFVKLMRIYYVVDVTTKKIYKTLFFAEAYFVWLALCLRREVVGEHAIHPTLLAMVKKLNALIQC